MQAIDVASILFLFVVVCTVIAVYFTIEALLFKKKDSRTLMYIASKYVQAIAIGLLILPGYGNNTTLIVIENIIYFLAFAGEIYIISTINTTRHKLTASILLTAIIFASLYNITNALIHPVLAYRIFVVGIFTLFLYVYLGYVLLKKGNSKMLRVTGWISCLFAIPWGLRTYYAFMHMSTAQILVSNIFQTPAYIANIIFYLGLPMLYLFINKEHDQQKLREQYSKIAAQNDEIRSKNEALKELNAAKDKFFRIIGHDLKSPIGQMVQFFQLIEEEYDNLSSEYLLDLIKTLKESSVRGFKLLENLLEWARSQTGNISFNPEPVIISDLIKENIELLEKQAETKHIKITTSDLYPGTIKVDRNMINTIVRNLLSNAIKFTRNNGEIEISNQTDLDQLIISVKDNGVGMSDDECRMLFKLGSEHTKAGTDNEKGTGLGLVLCKEFVDKHKGSIWIESKLGEGSVFSFSVPLKNQ